MDLQPGLRIAATDSARYSPMSADVCELRVAGVRLRRRPSGARVNGSRGAASPMISAARVARLAGGVFALAILAGAGPHGGGIPAGQEELVLRMLGAGATLPEGCRLLDAAIG